MLSPLPPSEVNELRSLMSCYDASERCDSITMNNSLIHAKAVEASTSLLWLVVAFLQIIMFLQIIVFFAAPSFTLP